MSDVWCLENKSQIMGSEDLSRICEFAVAGHRKSQNYLKKLWGEKWPRIKEKLLTEGSVWYVWWMDVRTWNFWKVRTKHENSRTTNI